MANRPSYPVLIALIAGTLIPLLYLLDYLVDRTRTRPILVEGELRVHLDGQRPLVLAGQMEEVYEDGTLELAISAPLRQGSYPWQQTSFQGSFHLRLRPELIETGPGRHDAGFQAWYSVRDLSRDDGWGIARVPCRGNVVVGQLDWGRQGFVLEQATLDLELVCVAAGPDLEFGSGDERGWAIEGQVRTTKVREG